VGHWRAEKGQQAVAHQTGDSAFIFIDWPYHLLESAVDDLRPFLGIELFGQRGGALNIAEEHGDDAPLSGRPSRRRQLGQQLAGNETIK